MTTPKEPAYRKRVGYQAGLLGGFTMMAAAFLVMGNIATRDAIEQRRMEDLLAMLPITRKAAAIMVNPPSRPAW